MSPIIPQTTTPSSRARPAFPDLGFPTLVAALGSVMSQAAHADQGNQVYDHHETQQYGEQRPVLGALPTLEIPLLIPEVTGVHGQIHHTPPAEPFAASKIKRVNNRKRYRIE